ncbi:MAG: hypothetical protein H7258_05340 [Ferruginibacter sp.]|nr:hypothetical protein [Ferruginibacter sp.]
MSFQVQKIRKSETVEVVVANINSRVYKFSDNETTLDKVVLQAIAINTEALGKSFSGRTIMSNAEMKKGYLTLATPDTKTPIKRIPLETFFNNQNFITYFEDVLIDLRKSTVDFPNSAALVLPADGQGFSIPITIFYRDMKANEKIGDMGEVLSDY